MSRFSNQVAIVTGAGQGMGAAIAQRFAAEGALVVCADLTDPSDLVGSLPAAADVEHRARQVDVTDSAAVEELVTDTVEQSGRLDIMVNNAGIYDTGAIADTSDADFERIMRVNLFGVFYGCRAAGRVMRTQGHGRIVNSASEIGKAARPNEGVYASSKAAVISLTQSAALELAPNVNVNAVCPGAIQTPLLERAFEKVAAQRGTTMAGVIDEFVEQNIPLGRLGQPSDMAAMVTWLCSEDASFTTGAALNMSGGQHVFF